MKFYFSILFLIAICSCSNNIASSNDLQKLETFQTQINWTDRGDKSINYVLLDSIVCTQKYVRVNSKDIEKEQFDKRLLFFKNLDSFFLSQMQDGTGMLNTWYELNKIEGNDTLWAYRENCNCINAIFEKYKLSKKDLKDEKTKKLISNFLVEAHRYLEGGSAVSSLDTSNWQRISKYYQEKILFCEFGYRNKKNELCNCNDKKNYSLLLSISLLNFINIQLKSFTTDFAFLRHGHLYSEDISGCEDNSVFYQYFFYENSNGILQVKSKILNNPMPRFIE